MISKYEKKPDNTTKRKKLRAALSPERGGNTAALPICSA